MKKILHLASQSYSRQQLLKESKIPFALLAQDADESVCDWTLPLDKLVASISLYKMNHVVLPEGKEGDVMFVLTGDTLCQDSNGTIQGKPKDREDAIAKIKQARGGSKLCSAFCLDKKVYKDGAWKTAERIHEVVYSEYLFYVPDNWIDRYLDNSIGLSCSNAIAIELYGAQFLKYVRGSYSTIVGLPMYELREALERIGFFV
jgi:septum formation protein